MVRETDGAQSLVDASFASNRLQTGKIWRELHTFLAVARYGSANRAAEALGISHTSVGRQLRRLNDVLGDQLVSLTRKGAVLTPKGDQLASALTEVDTILANTLSAPEKGSSTLKATIRVRVTDGIGFTFLVPALDRLNAQYPGLSLSLNRPRPYGHLHSKASDIIVGFGNDASADMSVRPLGSLHMVPFASRAYVARHGADPVSPKQRHRFVDSARYTAAGALWQPWRDFVRTGDIAHSSDASVTYGLLVKAGQGIGLMPAHNVGEPSLVALDVGWSIRLDLHAVCLTERLRSRGMKVAMTFLESALGERQPWLSRDNPLVVGRPASPPAGYARLLNLDGP